jgi:DNA-binding CsgD family transcriptional regulator
MAEQISGTGEGFTLAEARVLADCAYLAGSGRANQSVVEIFAQLQPVVRQDAAALMAWDSLTGEHVVLGSSTYHPTTLTGLGEPYAKTDAHLRLLRTKRPFRINDLPYDYRKTTLYQEVLRPAGFGDGMTTCLFAPDGAYAGMLHLSAESPTAFVTRHVHMIEALAASLGRLCGPRRPRSALLPADEGSRASLVDHTGRPRVIDEYEPATCLADPDFGRFVERLLRTRTRVLFGVWPVHGSWVCLRVERVQDSLFEHSAALLVTESPWQAPYGLSTRELDILNGLAQGASNQRIASERSISVRTVTTHVERILAKLGQESRAGAAAKAAREGLLRLDLVATRPGET